MLAFASLWAALIGSIYAAVVFPKNPAVLWAAFPIGLATAGLAATRTDRISTLWMPIGGLWGFAILGAWTLGGFFAPAAWLLTLAGTAHVVRIRSWWHAVVLPFWLLAGASSVAVMFFVRDEIERTTTTQAPAVVFGVWLFVGAVGALSGLYLGRYIWKSSNLYSPYSANDVGVSQTLTRTTGNPSWLVWSKMRRAMRSTVGLLSSR